jgi:hypothetical protein
VCHFKWLRRLHFCKNDLLQNEQLSCFSPVCSISWPWRKHFCENDFLQNNSYKLSLQRNSRMILTVIQHTERFCTLMAGKGFLSTVHSRTNLENVHSFKWFCTQKAAEEFLPSVHSHVILKDAWRWGALSPLEGYPTHQMILYTEGSCRYSNQSVLVSCGP